MELKTKSFSTREMDRNLKSVEMEKLFEENKIDFHLWELMAMNAKLKCTMRNNIEIMEINDIFFKENIGKIMKIIYNDFKGTKRTVKMKCLDENNTEKEYRVTFFIDIKDKRIQECRIVLSKEDEVPFRLYQIEILMEGKFVKKLVYRNIVLIIINILNNRGYSDSDVENFIKTYLNAVNDLKIN